MSRCRPQATPPSPPPPPLPRVLHQHLEGIGMGGGNGTPGSGGRNGEAASPTRPPSVRVRHLHRPCDTRDYLSSQPSPSNPHF